MVVPKKNPKFGIPGIAFKRAAFFQSLKSKVGLAAAKAMRINLNVEGCGIVAAPVHAPSRATRAPLVLPLLLLHHTISLSRGSLKSAAAV